MDTLNINVDVIEQSTEQFKHSATTLNAGKQETNVTKTTIKTTESINKQLSELSYIMAKLQNIIIEATEKVEVGKATIVELDQKIAQESE